MNHFKKKYIDFPYPFYIRVCYLSILSEDLYSNRLDNKYYDNLLHVYSEIMQLNKNNTPISYNNVLNKINNNIKDKNDDIKKEIVDIIKFKCTNNDDIHFLEEKIKNLNIDNDLKDNINIYKYSSYGIESEDLILNKFLEEKKLNKKEDKKYFFHKNINNTIINLIMIGTPDCVTDDDKIIEVKTRIKDINMNKFIRRRDRIQLQAYLNISDKNEGYLVEGNINKYEQYIIPNNNESQNDVNINYFHVKKDVSYFNNIIRTSYPHFLLIFLIINNQDIYHQYTKLTPDDNKILFIKLFYKKLKDYLIYIYE